MKMIFKRLIFLLSLIFSINSVITTQCAIDITCESRRTPGPICLEADSMSDCFYDGIKWYSIKTSNCEKGKTFCNTISGICDDEYGGCNPNVPSFDCNNKGFYPDPLNCRKYHICTSLSPGGSIVPLKIDCPGESAFDAATNECSARLNTTICTKPQFTCSHVGESHPWPGNSNIFYTCLSVMVGEKEMFVPRLFRCPVGTIHNGHKCIEIDDITTTTEEITSTTELEWTTTTAQSSSSSTTWSWETTTEDESTTDYETTTEYWETTTEDESTIDYETTTVYATTTKAFNDRF